MYDLKERSLKPLDIHTQLADWFTKDEIIYVDGIDGKYQLIKMNLNTLNKEVIFASNKSFSEMDVADNELVFIDESEDKIGWYNVYVLDLNTKEIKAVGNGYLLINNPRLNRDGSLIIFTERAYGYGSRLHIIDLDTLEDEPILYGTGKAYYDGVFIDDKIVYIAEGTFGEFRFEWSSIKNGTVNELPIDLINYLKNDLDAYWVDGTIVVKNDTNIIIHDNLNEIIITLLDDKASIRYNDKNVLLDAGKRFNKYGDEIIDIYGPPHAGIYSAMYKLESVDKDQGYKDYIIMIVAAISAVLISIKISRRFRNHQNES